MVNLEQASKLANADVEIFLLEKSRLFHQLPGERSFHIFYQLISGANDQLNKKLFLTGSPADYIGVNQGDLEVKGIKDDKEFAETEALLISLEFNDQELNEIWKILASVLHCGNFEFKTKKSGQAVITNSEPFENFSFLSGIKAEQFMEALMKPRVKVGTEWVNTEQTADQAKSSAHAFASASYEKLFELIVTRLNEQMWTNEQRRQFCSILDISGFENLNQNSFEQMTINLMNEKIQQVLHYQKFELEQEKYRLEGLDWQHVEYDLCKLGAIDLICAPGGIYSILEEECIYSKSTDSTFRDKLFQNHLGASESFTRQSSDVELEAHFEIKHFAGQVAYNCEGWIEKNRDKVWLNLTLSGN